MTNFAFYIGTIAVLSSEVTRNKDEQDQLSKLICKSSKRAREVAQRLCLVCIGKKGAFNSVHLFFFFVRFACSEHSCSESPETLSMVVRLSYQRLQLHPK